MVAAVVAVAGIAVSAYGSSQQASAAKKAGQAGASAPYADIAERQREYDQSRADQLSFLNTAYGALDRQNAALNGDFSGFEKAPDYLYTRQQMVQGMDRSAAAHGRLMSGGYGVDMASNLNGLAEQNFGNYWNRLAGQANQGQVAAGNLQQLGQSTAQGMSNAYTNAANARSQSAYGVANANTNMANQVGQWGAWYAGQNNFGGV